MVTSDFVMGKADFIIMCLLAASTTFSFAWAFIGALKKKRGYYYNLITICLAGFMISKIFEVLYFIADGNVYLFSTGDFGAASTMLFFVFANSYFLSKLVDDSKPVGKARKRIPYIVPIIYLASYIMLLFSDLGYKIMAIPTLLLLTGLPCGYQALKYSVMPDIKDGFISAMRPLNITFTVISLITMIGQLLWIPDDFYTPVTYVITAIGCLAYACAGPLLERGSAKWIA